MIDRISAPFRNTTKFYPGVPVNVADDLGGQGLAQGYSPGGAIIDNVLLQPPASAEASLLAYSFTGNIALLVESNGPTVYGKIGDIYTGLTFSANQTSGPTTSPPTPWQSGSSAFTGFSGVPPLPSDASMIEKIYDGTNDACPPLYNGTSGPAIPRQIASTLLLPQAISLQSGSRLSAGIWITPELLGSSGGVGGAGLLVWNASYTIIYDNGL